jgi:nitrogenase subunit NifH
MEFSKMRVTRTEIQDLFVKLEKMKDKIQEHYGALLLQNETTQFFGLDSFRFQVKLMENEMKHLKEQAVFIENRLYCDYYKLHIRVHTYLAETFHYENRPSSHPLYKDLEPFKVYEFEHTEALYQEIVTVLQKAYDMLEIEVTKRAEDERLNQTGIHIGNYLHNRVFKYTIIQTNIGLYEQYLNTYFMYHMNFLTNLKERIEVYLNQFTRPAVPVHETENVITVQETVPESEIIPESVIETAESIETISESIETAESVIENVVESIETISESVIDTLANSENVESDSVIESLAESIEIVAEPVIDTLANSENVESDSVILAESIEIVAESVIETVPVIETIPIIETLAESVIETVPIIETIPIIETLAESVIETVPEPVLETIEPKMSKKKHKRR